MILQKIHLAVKVSPGAAAVGTHEARDDMLPT